MADLEATRERLYATIETLDFSALGLLKRPENCRTSKVPEFLFNNLDRVLEVPFDYSAHDSHDIVCLRTCIKQLLHTKRYRKTLQPGEVFNVSMTAMYGDRLLIYKEAMRATTGRFSSPRRLEVRREPKRRGPMVKGLLEEHKAERFAVFTDNIPPAAVDYNSIWLAGVARLSTVMMRGDFEGAFVVERDAFHHATMREMADCPDVDEFLMQSDLETFLDKEYIDEYHNNLYILDFDSWGLYEKGAGRSEDRFSPFRNVFRLLPYCIHRTLGMYMRVVGNLTTQSTSFAPKYFANRCEDDLERIFARHNGKVRRLYDFHYLGTGKDNHMEEVVFHIQ